MAEIRNYQSELELLEKTGKDLVQGSRTKETAAVKSKLSSLRRQWEVLKTQAEDDNATLSSHASHYTEYQNLVEDLSPFLKKAEKYLQEERGRCGSLDDSQEQHQQHLVSCSVTICHGLFYSRIVSYDCGKFYTIVMLLQHI